MKTTNIQSTNPGQRLVSIDILRGVAVLGILIMNIQSFSMVSAAYSNPMAYGDMTGLNKWIFIFSHIIADTKFMSLFSILFGASILLFAGRLQATGLIPSKIFYRLNSWLLLFGLIHGFLIWHGDILLSYALCGYLVFLFRNNDARKLIRFSAVFFTIPILFTLFSGLTISLWDTSAYTQSMESWLPAAESVKSETAAFTGTWFEQFSIRAYYQMVIQIYIFFMHTLWRAFSMMLLGMALFKSGVLTGEKSRVFYVKLSSFGLLAGFGIIIIGLFQNFKVNWLMDNSMYIGSLYNYIGSVFVAMGYIGVIMLCFKSKRFKRLKLVLSAVGKMAFTNYIMMSVICTFIFYGFGLSLFGEIERTGQILITIGIWILILIWSPLWLKYFKYGPLEKLWRNLTYWRKERA